ncbi:hypothetical protein TSUD_32100 [Trifolium subterraneum]|uniref:F-box associated beta-propeller type 1 domain-containing protein n=1 Tax=Trifolium subterraneum TaxID=3900 RepID=A0A2Z6LQQ5_TRISU|nr:hypothetical protein TSUD_32100 [Trifolium subterraneum]
MVAITPTTGGKVRKHIPFDIALSILSKLPPKSLRHIYIVGSISINGFLCLTNILDAESKLVLWNPITYEFNVIPPSPVESVPCTKVIPFIHGIGYDHLKDDYKVIRRVEFDNRSFDFLFDRELSMEEDLAISKEPLWEIYSLRSNSWKKLDVDMSMVMFPEEVEYIARFYMDGMCHWWDNVEKDSSDKTYFVSFDVSNEVFFTTPMPDVDDTFDLRLVKRRLVMLNGSITSWETGTLQISILGEIGVKESWTKLFIVGPLPYFNRPIGAGKNGDIFFVNKDVELACFNLDTGTIVELGIDTDLSQIILIAKYGLDIIGRRNIGGEDVTRIASIRWCDLCRLDTDSDWFTPSVGKKVGNRVLTSFWNDIWVGEQTLRQRFPQLFGIIIEAEFFRLGRSTSY